MEMLVLLASFSVAAAVSLPYMAGGGAVSLDPDTRTLAARLRARLQMAMATRDQTLSSRTFYSIPRGMVPSVS